MGGGKIRDATALPEDVRKGKVFYNNMGRQEGSLENPIEIKEYLLNAQNNIEASNSMTMHGSIIYQSGLLHRYSTGINSEMTNSFGFGKQVNLNYKSIIGYSINNQFFNNTYSSNDLYSMVERKSGEYTINFYNGSIYWFGDKIPEVKVYYV